MKIKEIFRNGAKFVDKNAPVILTAVAIVGLGVSVYESAKAGIKANEIIKEKKKDLESVEEGDKETEKQVKIELVKEIVPVVAPPVIATALTATCIIMSHKISARRLAAASAAYSIVDKKYKNYKEKIAEKLGKKKEEEAKQEAAKTVLVSNPETEDNTFYTTHGKLKCYDEVSGRYFTSSPQYIDKIVNELNYRLMTEMYISLNEFYMALGLEHIKLGDELGFNIERQGQIIVDKQYVSDENTGEPILVMSYDVTPRYNYFD